MVDDFRGTMIWNGLEREKQIGADENVKLGELNESQA